MRAESIRLLPVGGSSGRCYSACSRWVACRRTRFAARSWGVRRCDGWCRAAARTRAAR